MKDNLSKGMTFYALILLLSQAALAGNSHPKLILQITVDQLRGDLSGRFTDRFGEDGFLYARPFPARF